MELKTLRALPLSIFALTLLASCDFQDRILRSAMGGQASYFSTEDTENNTLTKVVGNVYTYNWYFDRTLIVRTDEGLVVVDSFSEHLAEGLLTALREADINEPVHTLIYSHYHLDHVLGGELLEPSNVISHRKAPSYWQQLGSRGAKVLQPTQFIDGDHEITVGGVRIQLIYLGNAHSDTQYAIFLPDQGVLYPPDTVSVRVFLPGGGPDIFMPGFLDALDRLTKLEFDKFVPSHFAPGTKSDFLESVEMLNFVQDLAEKTFESFDGPRPMFMDEDRAGEFFDAMYFPLKERYGDWHGFGQQALSAISRHYTGVYAGF